MGKKSKGWGWEVKELVLKSFESPAKVFGLKTTLDSQEG